MQSDSRVPMHVAVDVGPGEGASFLSWDRSLCAFCGVGAEPVM